MRRKQKREKEYSRKKEIHCCTWSWKLKSIARICILYRYISFAVVSDCVYMIRLHTTKSISKWAKNETFKFCRGLFDKKGDWMCYVFHMKCFVNWPWSYSPTSNRFLCSVYSFFVVVLLLFGDNPFESIWFQRDKSRRQFKNHTQTWHRHPKNSHTWHCILCAPFFFMNGYNDAITTPSTYLQMECSECCFGTCKLT